MALEKDLETRCRLLVEKRGGKLFKWKSPGNKGIHDRIVVLPEGYVAFCEFKKPSGRFQPLQPYWQKWFRERGHRTYVIDNYADFMKILPK